jgi:hypothetical protein
LYQNQDDLNDQEEDVEEDVEESETSDDESDGENTPVAHIIGNEDSDSDSDCISMPSTSESRPGLFEQFTR